MRYTNTILFLLASKSSWTAVAEGLNNGGRPGSSVNFTCRKIARVHHFHNNQNSLNTKQNCCSTTMTQFYSSKYKINGIRCIQKNTTIACYKRQQFCHYEHITWNPKSCQNSKISQRTPIRWNRIQEEEISLRRGVILKDEDEDEDEDHHLQLGKQVVAGVEGVRGVRGLELLESLPNVV